MVDETLYYDLSSDPHRFYVVEFLAATDARKISPSGIRNLRYLDLSKIFAGFNPRREYTTNELATALKGTTWQ